MKIAVYCGAQEGHSPVIHEAAKELGTWIGDKGYTLVYGAASNGIMGIVADATLAAGGEVIGVIPDFLTGRESIHPDITQLELVENMSVRKKRMIDLADFAITLPGGPGTLEEVTEVISWNIIEHTETRAIVYNVEDYYAPLQAMYQSMVDFGFLRSEVCERINFVADLEGIKAVINGER